MQYTDPSLPTHSEIKTALERKDYDFLSSALIGLSLYEENYAFCAELILGLAQVPHVLCKGNALLAMGHLARRFGKLPEEAKDLIEEGLLDEHEHVQKQSYTAAMDATSYLGWDISGYE